MQEYVKLGDGEIHGPVRNTVGSLEMNFGSGPMKIFQRIDEEHFGML